MDATTMITEMIWVTIEPPILSEIQPPTGRIKAPTKGPIQAQVRALGPSGLLTRVTVPSAATSIMLPKIMLIDSGKAAEKPMNEPKVRMYSTVMDQVCLLLKMANWFLMLGLMSPGIRRRSTTVRTMVRGKATHMLMMDSAQTPTMDVRMPTPYNPRILPNAEMGEPGFGVTTFRLFMPNQPAKASGIRKTNQMKPAF